MINARAETLAERPAFRDAFAERRCLIVADGFYEWQPREHGPKQPWWITREDHEPFAFAGLWASLAPGARRRAAAQLHDHHDAGDRRRCARSTTGCR